jgi:hypothetical protein
MAKEAAIHQTVLMKAHERDKSKSVSAQCSSLLSSVDISGDGGSSSLNSVGEMEMWADYEMNGADFDVGEDREAVIRAKYAQQERLFNLWNAGCMAKELGCSDGDKDALDLLEGEPEDEQVLSDLLENLGEL